MLIDNWKTYYKRYSVQLQAVAVAVWVYLSDTSNLIALWALLPAEFKAVFTPEQIRYAAVALIVFAMIAGIVKQKKLQQGVAK